MVVSYPYPPMFSQYTAYLRRPYSVTGLNRGCASRIFINISALRQC